MSGGGGGQTVNNDPWIGSQPYIKDLNKLSYWNVRQQADHQYYPGQTVTDFDPATEAMFGRMVGGNSIKDTAAGKYLGMSEPLMNAVVNPVMQSVNSQFSQAGRYGSQMHGDQLTEAATRAMMPYYDTERQRQLQAEQAYQGMLGQVGAMREGKQAERIADDMTRYNFERDNMNQALTQYAGLLQGTAGLGGSTTMPGGSRAAGVLGGAASGAGIASSLGLAGPWGWGLAGLGGLLGAFG